MIHTLSRLSIIGLFAVAPGVWAQQDDAGQSEGPAVFAAELVTGMAKAVDYGSQSGAPQIDFVGTDEASFASGKASVRNQGAGVEIDCSFEGLPDPQSFGSEYLTHVLWAVSPEGRVSNLGEIQRDKRGRAKHVVTADLQVFGMVVTAEPYYAVRTPSNVIVMENGTTKKSKGQVSFIDAKYELLKRGVYEPFASPLSVDLDHTPLAVYQARNAFTIAESVGARNYAEDSLKRAQANLEMASSETLTKGHRKQVIALSLQAVQFAEDARAQTVERQRAERQR